jgi:hypothetical protein
MTALGLLISDLSTNDRENCSSLRNQVIGVLRCWIFEIDCTSGLNGLGTWLSLFDDCVWFI